MREVFPGHRLVRGKSGIVFEVPAAVATGLMRSGQVEYADEAPEVEAPAAPAAAAPAPAPAVVKAK